MNKCKYCGASFTTNEKLKRHYKGNMGFDYPCLNLRQGLKVKNIYKVNLKK